ncbi:hypothetical protein NMY22_g13552 [Coprinellus aureogranulatus]|nr:hypothetical protein NMY22_g13552 [Coprinellus aureogranulatus]
MPLAFPWLTASTLASDLWQTTRPLSPPSQSTKPIWAYCPQGNHCGQGMVFSVNAVEGGDKSFQAFQDLAKQINGTAGANGGSGGYGNSGFQPTVSSASAALAALFALAALL